MKNIYVLKVCCAVSLFISACATTPTVVTYADPAQSFEQYKSFAWISDEPMLVSGDREPYDYIVTILQSSIVEDLTSKGYTFIDDAENADMAVSFTVGTREDLVIRDNSIDYFGSNWRWGHDNFYRNSSSNYQSVHKYTEGSLSIDIYDVERKSPVWHGGATKDLSSAELKGDSVESTKEAVKTILANFPPQ